MAIEPIGTGVIGMGGMGFSQGFYGGSRGVSVYRKNAADGALPQISVDTGAYPKSEPAEKGAVSDKNDLRRRFDSYECQTCKNRKYQDGSDDPGVSFQTPTRVNPRSAASAVRSHEQEHVGRNQAKAKREGKEIVSQNVTIHTAICPECGKVYVSGGTTRTVTKNSDSGDGRYGVGLFDPESGKGDLLDMSA